MNLNKAIIVGNVTRDPETRTTPSGQNVTTFGIATNRYWKNPQGEKQNSTEFHNIVAWGRLSEISGQYLKKGSLVLIEGRLQTRNWEGQDGAKRNRTEIVAESMQLGPKPGGTPQDGPPAAQSPEESIPTINQDTPVSSAPATEEVDVESIPF